MRKTIQIAGISLEPFYHNIIGNDKCDGWKSEGIGQSAAKVPLGGKCPTTKCFETYEKCNYRIRMDRI